MATRPVFQTPVRFTSMTSSHCCSAEAKPPGPIPALATTIVTGPSSATPSSNAFCSRLDVADVGLVGDDASPERPPPVGRSRRGRPASTSGSRRTRICWQMSMAMMSAPSCAIRMACARPWPRAAPVMKATCPSSLPMICPLACSDPSDHRDRRSATSARNPAPTIGGRVRNAAIRVCRARIRRVQVRP